LTFDPEDSPKIGELVSWRIGEFFLPWLNLLTFEREGPQKLASWRVGELVNFSCLG